MRLVGVTGNINGMQIFLAKVIPSKMLFVCFLLRRHEAIAVSDLGSLAKLLLMLAWVTNVSTSPDLYIEFSTEY